ncbi:MAG: STAS domain-containing protein [Neisseria sp.]|nr:STAS domain-containing protein [Neisseria sp.]
MRQERTGDTLTVSGDINNRTVTRDTYRTFTQHVADGVRHVTFSGAAQVDSACVALLIAAKRTLRDADLTISDAPPALVDLLKLYRLNEWITLS